MSPGSEFTAYKLQLNESFSVQGLIACAIRDGYVELDLIEKAPYNRKPHNQFVNVGEVLFGKACQISMEHGSEGIVVLKAKSGLMLHYINRYGMMVTPEERTEAHEYIVKYIAAHQNQSPKK